MALQWRPLTTGDLPAWAELLARVEAVDGIGEHYSAADLAQRLANADLPRASIAAVEGDRIVGYGLIRLGRAISRVAVASLEGGVDPEFRRRGIGTRIVEFFATRAAELAGGHDLELRCHASDRNAGLAVLMAAAGFEPVRWLLDLERDLAEPVPPAVAPPGTVLAPFDAVPSEQVRQARNEAFAGHWVGGELGAAEWRRFLAAPSFRPDLSHLALDAATSRPLGLLLASYFEADSAATGVREVWIHAVGTRRAARGLGVADALLTHALGGYRDAGFERASLSVDSEQPADVSGIHEQSGFVLAHRWTVYSRR